MRTRAELLTDLADAINELTQPRTITEYREVTHTEQITTGRRKRARRTRRREAHRVTLPGLLAALESAAIPGAGDGPGALGSFESRPSAELEPLSVLREITDDAGRYARRFRIDRPTLAGTIRGLVSLQINDVTLAEITRQAVRWVRRAGYATGVEPPPVTLDQPCPYCLARNAIVLTGDLTMARCNRCGIDWTPETIGLLADMIRANQEQPTMPAVPCWMADCTRRGPHDEHQDHRGRTWRREDRCIDADGRTTRQLDAGPREISTRRAG